MDYTCLMCNHLIGITKPCFNCGRQLEHLGLLQDFYDPYSPYLDQEIYQDHYKQYDKYNCVHVMYCAHCDTDYFYAFKRLSPLELH